MPKYGILVDYEFCIGCHSCEVACKQEHGRPDDEWGIRLHEERPETSGGRMYYFPFPTDNCNLCGKRISKGKEPACVKHCWAGVMKFGEIEELAGYMKKKNKTVLWVPH